MRWPRLVIVLFGLGAAGAAAMPVDHPFGLTGFALPPGGATAAAAWRRNKQVLTVDDHNTLLFWDTPSRRLIDSMLLPGLPLPPQSGPDTRRFILRVTPDGSVAAVSEISGVTTTVLVDLVAHKVTATLDRPALFWTAAALVAGPRAGCMAACDFATVDPRTAAATSVGTGFGDGRVVVATPDGSRFATVVPAPGRQDLVVWDSATWAPVVRAPLTSDPVIEVGFDHAATRAFARQPAQLIVVGMADGKATTTPLSPWAGTAMATTDLDQQRMMTARGPIALTATPLLRANSGGFRFYTADPRGAIYDFEDNSYAAIGAQPAKPNAFPWQVELQYRAPPGSYFSPVALHNCGGSLIRPGWVVTATHCFLTADNILRSDEEAREHTVVRAGSVDLDGDMAVFDVAEVYIRRCGALKAAECFHDSDPAAPSPPLNDITLLRIVPHVEPTVVRSYTLRERQPGKIAPISLPSARTEVRPLTPVTMTGWGATSSANAQDHLMSLTLGRIDVAVMPRETCSRHHGFGPLAPTLICAGSTDDAQLACKGDSGGPLVADLDRKAQLVGGPPVHWKPVLVGIVSWGSCNGGPAVYTRVAAFVPWINATIAAAEARK